MARFPSQEWVDAFSKAINASTVYRGAAETWEGAIAFQFEAEPDKGVPDDVWALLDLWHGECRHAAIVAPQVGAQAPYVIRAPYSRWRSILEGDLDPIKAMMQGKLKVRGNLAKIVKYVRAANELVRLTGTVPTEFVGDTA